MPMEPEDKIAMGLGIGCIAGLLLMFALWATHVIVCIKTASWVLLVVGAIVFPVGMIHGFGIWFGLV